jgi:type II secretory pathway predicted ATPase ExeA
MAREVIRSAAAMFLLVTGASGAGKSTVRRAAAASLSPEVECVELHHVISVPAIPTIAWRHQATEAAVQRALQLQAEGRHLFAEPCVAKPRHAPVSARSPASGGT